jgi:hypothetical protein
VNFVIASKAVMDVIFVFPRAAVDVVGDAGVEDTRFAGQDVNVEITH